MCGILLILSRGTDTPQDDRLLDFVKRRGPDCFASYTVQMGESCVRFSFALLSLRGEKLTPQPVILSDGSVLLFNGEIFGCSSQLSDQPLQDASDTQMLTNILENNRQQFPQIFSSIKGPYAFVFFDKPNSKIWYGRDIVGRRSLCRYVTPEEDQLIICSVAPYSGWQEVTTEGIHCVHLSGAKLNHSLCHWSHSLSGHAFTFSTSQATIPTPISTKLIDVKGMNEAIQGLRKFLSSAIRKRVLFRRKDANIGILFSGGIDSVITTFLASQFLPDHEEIDLLNVAFKADAPDRLTSIKAHEVLSKLCPNRVFNLVLIDPSIEELNTFRSERIRYLIYPSQTVLDDSIGCALWFASRGAGVLYGSGDSYKSTAPILLHGLGADEMMAGYTRHRRVYDQSGKSLQSLQQELNMDLERLHSRNLGRDDRVISDHGKEVRLPFLDEDVISFLNAVPTEFKCNLDEPRGVGEKKLLRELAASLGLGEISSTEKRALQFGSRIANLEGKKEDGSSNCSRLEL